MMVVTKLLKPKHIRRVFDDYYAFVNKAFGSSDNFKDLCERTNYIKILPTAEDSAIYDIYSYNNVIIWNSVSKKLESIKTYVERGWTYPIFLEDEDWNHYIGCSIRGLLIVRGMTVREFTDIFQCSRNRATALLEGTTEPSAQTVLRICRYFNITVDELLRY